jgi:hypothetical protein
MKDSLMAVGITALVFAAGYLVGKQQKQQTARYVFEGGLAGSQIRGIVFDSRTGVFYKHEENNLGPISLFRYDLVNGKVDRLWYSEVEEEDGYYYTID